MTGCLTAGAAEETATMAAAREWVLWFSSAAAQPSTVARLVTLGWFCPSVPVLSKAR